MTISSCASAAQPRLPDAKAGKNGGFKNAAFVEAGKRLHEFGALEPFQPGYLQTSHAQSAGIFGDGKAAMDLMGQWFLGMQAPNSASGKGIPDEDIGILSFPTVPGGKGKATDTLGGINGFLVTARARRPRPSISSTSSARRNTPRRPPPPAPTFPS